MKKRLSTIVTLLVILTLIVTHFVSAQEIAVGVSPGNQFTYSVTGSHSTDDPSAEIPEEVLNAEASVYFRVVIDNVTGSEIGYSWLWHLANGTDQNGNGTLNLETTANTGPFWAIVPANLTTGERIHPHFGPDTSSFNQTVKWSYDDNNYTRDTNRLDLEFAYQNNVTLATKTEHSEAYFDKLTGMLVQLNDETSYQNPEFKTVITWKLIGQNVWTFSSPGSYPPEPFFTLPVIVTIAVAIAVVIVIAAWVVSNKRKDARKRQLLRKK